MKNDQIQRLIDINPNPVILAERGTGRILFHNSTFGKENPSAAADTLFALIVLSEKEKLSSLLIGDTTSGTFNFTDRSGAPVTHKLQAEYFSEDIIIISFMEDELLPASGFAHQLIDNLSDELHQSSSKLETIVNNLPMVLLELDSEGTFVLQEGKALADAGYQPGQLVGSKFHDTLGAIKITSNTGEVINAVEAFDRVMNGDVVAGHTFIEGRFFDNYFVPVKKNNTVPSGLLGICLDITERVNFERSYRDTAQLFRLIADNTSDLISMVSNGSYLYISPSYEKIFGYTLDEVRKLGPKSLVHPDDLPLLADWQTKGMVEFRVRNKKGDYLWIEGESFVIAGDPVISVGIARNVTKRKAAEDALKVSEERYRMLFERNPLPMFVYDEETYNFLAVNESAVSHYGYSRDEFKNMSILDIRPNVDIPELINIFKTQGKGMNRFGTWRHLLKNGYVINVDVTTHSITFNGRPARLVLADDITAKVKAQNALRESEEKYRIIAENANEGILLIDHKQKVTFVNSKLAGIVGRSKEELENKPVLDFVFDEDISRAGRYIKDNAAGSRETFQFRLKHKEGSERWVKVNAVPVFDEENRYAGGLALITDITEQRKAEAEHHRLNELLRSLINYSPLAIIILDKEGKTELWNNASEKMFGWSSDEVMGKPLPFVTEEKLEEHIGFRDAVLKGESFIYREVVRVRKDGKKINVSIAAAPLLDSNDHPMGISSFLIDITEKKKSESEREKLFRQITSARNRLKILSARLISVQETEKRTISRELHDEIGQMLTAIKIDVQRIKDGGNAPEVRELADDCTKLVENTISVVRNLSLELRPAMIDDLGLPASLRWYLDKFHQRTGIDVKTEIKKMPHTLPPECAITLFRICQEALTNIAKHAEAGYVKVSLNQKNSSVILTIEDDGKGFDTQKALKQAATGKSLGLISMQERAELLGGRFVIKSAIGSGTIIKASCQV